MNTRQRIVLVIGGTGSMGSEVLRHLLGITPGGWVVRVLTRDPAGARASALSERYQNLELVAGTVTNEQDLRLALRGVEAVFCNTDYWSLWSESGKSLEAEVGWTILRLAQEAGVSHFIYSSAEHATALSAWTIAVPHFDAKAEVERRIKDARYTGDAWFRTSVSVLTTAPYFENFLSFFRPRYDTVTWELEFALPIGEARWTMVALADIGWFAAHMLSEGSRWRGRDLAIASDSLTIKDIAAVFSSVTGLRSRGISPEDGVYLAGAGEMGPELLPMFKFVRAFGLWRDFQSLREINPGLHRFEDWVRQIDWKKVLE